MNSIYIEYAPVFSRGKVALDADVISCRHEAGGAAQPAGEAPAAAHRTATPRRIRRPAQYPSALTKRHVTAMNRVRAVCSHVVARPSPAAAAGTAPPVASEGAEGYSALIELFDTFRSELFNERRTDVAMDFDDDHVVSLPDFSAAAMADELAKLQVFQKRLMAIDPSSWEVAAQIDYHLVRAEMNGVEFRHKVRPLPRLLRSPPCRHLFFQPVNSPPSTRPQVLKPWATDPGFYNDAIGRLGIAEKKGQIELDLPLHGSALSELRVSLESVGPLVEAAKVNLSADFSLLSADLASLAVFMLGDTQLSYRKVVDLVPAHHPELAATCEVAAAAVDDYVAWIEANMSSMTATVGVGKENYDWVRTVLTKALA